MGTAEVTDPGISSHRAQGHKTSLILTYSQLDMMSCFQQSADPLWTNPSKRNPMLEVMENIREVQIYLLSRTHKTVLGQRVTRKTDITGPTCHPQKCIFFSLEKFVARNSSYAFLKRMSLCLTDSNWIVYALKINVKWMDTPVFLTNGSIQV